MHRFFHCLVFVGISLTAWPVARSQDFLEVGTSSGMGNLTVSDATPLSYNIGITTAGGAQGISVGRVLLTINRGSQTSAPVVIDLYNAFGAASGTGAIIASTTIPANQIPQAGYGTVSSSFALPVALPAAGYSVRVSSASPGSGADKYQIKSGAMSLYTSGSTLAPSYSWVQDNNSTGSAGTGLVAAGTVLAQYVLGTNAVRVGNYRVGTSLSATTSLVNTALVTSNTVTQALAASATVSGGVASVSGLPSPFLGVGGTAAVIASLNGAITGPNSGTATLSFQSVPGTSQTTGTTAVGDGTITLSGTGYDWAQAAYSGTTLHFGYIHRGGAAASRGVSIGNEAVADASFQDSLDVSATADNPRVSAVGFSGLEASANGAVRRNVVVSAATGTAGPLNSTVGLSLQSNANGIQGLSNGTALVVGSPGVITTSGTVFTGQSTWNSPHGGEWGSFAGNFGTNWNWSTFDGSPGVADGFADTDTATFSGAVASGTATVTITAATPSIRSLRFDNAAARYRITGASGGALALLNAGTASALVAVDAGSHTVALPVTLGSDTTFDVATGSGLSLTGVLGGAKAVKKTGLGTAVLSGDNTYGGATSVAAGRLLIHGSQTSATGPITVESGATLGGRGAAGGAVTVLAGGTLSPGASVESLVVGATTLSGTSTFFYELDSSVALSEAADLLVTNGPLTIGVGAILELSDLASPPDAFAIGTKFALISYGTNGWNGGLFSFAGGALANGSRFSAGFNEWEIRYDDPAGGVNFVADQLAGSAVTITAVPEPGTVVLVAAAALVWTVGRCRSRERRLRDERSRVAGPR